MSFWELISLSPVSGISRLESKVIISNKFCLAIREAELNEITPFLKKGPANDTLIEAISLTTSGTMFKSWQTFLIMIQLLFLFI